MKKLILAIVLFSVTFGARAEDDSKKKKIKYKKSKKIDFESLLIQGEKKRAEIFVVTGDSDESLDGLLRLRDNFIDQQEYDFGEEVR